MILLGITFTFHFLLRYYKMYLKSQKIFHFPSVTIENVSERFNGWSPQVHKNLVIPLLWPGLVSCTKCNVMHFSSTMLHSIEAASFTILLNQKNLIQVVNSRPVTFKCKTFSIFNLVFIFLWSHLESGSWQLIRSLHHLSYLFFPLMIY
jgi:hypothetical protein